jgi:cytoskeleton protein RodZ
MSYGLGILLVGLVIVWWRSQGGFDFEKDLLAELPDLVAEKVDHNRTPAKTVVKEDQPTQITASPAETGISQSVPQTSKLIASSAADMEQQATSSAMREQDEPPHQESVSPPAVRATASSQLPTVPATQVGKIVLKFSQGSWAEIRDASNERLLHQSFHAGREIEVEGMPPFSVFLGNAAGVHMEYNGKPFDITPHQTGLYARFVIDGAGGN